ncbi:hypothetical protein R3I94_023243 [Phoxinus phoxinus]
MCGEGQQVYCQHCEMMMYSETSCSLQKVPSVLVLHLERFELDYDTMCCVKNYSSVEIPAQLSVKDEAVANHRYDLYAIANHSGSLSGGHYYADIKVADNQWYHFDDSIAQKMCDPDKHLVSNEAYLLLYKKCDSKSPQNNSTYICNDPEDPCNQQQDTSGADVSSSAGSGSTEDTERPEKQIKRANTWSQEDCPKSPKCRRYSEPDNPQTNQQTEHTVRDEQDLQNNSDFNSETEARPSQTQADESTGIQSTDADYFPEPNDSLSHEYRHPEHTDNTRENEHDSVYIE